MTQIEIEQNLKESFSAQSSGVLTLIKRDYRRLEARYVCTAEEHRFLCTGFRPSHVGSCMSYQDGICRNSGVINE